MKRQCLPHTFLLTALNFSREASQGQGSLRPDGRDNSPAQQGMRRAWGLGRVEEGEDRPRPGLRGPGHCWAGQVTHVLGQP